MGSHRVGHDWNALAAAANTERSSSLEWTLNWFKLRVVLCDESRPPSVCWNQIIFSINKAIFWGSLETAPLNPHPRRPQLPQLPTSLTSSKKKIQRWIILRKKMSSMHKTFFFKSVKYISNEKMVTVKPRVWRKCFSLFSHVTWVQCHLESSFCRNQENTTTQRF